MTGMSAILSGLSASWLIGPLVDFATDVYNMEPVLIRVLVIGILMGGLYALVALGLTMIFGVMDVINFAHGALMVVGMYAVWYITITVGVHPFLTIPIAVLIVAVVGLVMHLLTIRPIMEEPQENQLIVTFGVLLIIVSTFEIVFSPDPRAIPWSVSSVSIGFVSIPPGQLLALVLAIIAMVVTWAVLKFTMVGRAIRGVADNRIGARYVGINVERIDALTFSIGAALAGLAGAAIPFIQRIDPYVGDVYLIYAFVIVVLGGLGSFPGAIIGGLIIGIVQAFTAFYFHGTMYNVFIFVIFIAVLLLKPTGLFGGD